MDSLNEKPNPVESRQGTRSGQQTALQDDKLGAFFHLKINSIGSNFAIFKMQL